MHLNPFGHDQNGWDAWLCHSIPDSLGPTCPKGKNVSFAVLDTSVEFPLLDGWSGSSDEDVNKTILLHVTNNHATLKQKRRDLSELFDAARDSHGEEAKIFEKVL